MRITAFPSLLAFLFVAGTLACRTPPEQGPTEPPKVEEPAPDPGQGEPSACDFEADPAKIYVGRSPQECATIRFMCTEDRQYFADACGCGCELTSG